MRRWFRLGSNRAEDAVRDVADEIELHIELRAAELRAGGMDATAAAAEARRRFARDAHTLRDLHETARDRNRHMRMRERWEAWGQDVRYAAGALRRDSLLTAFVVVTLALGIGANVTSFSLLDRLLLRPPAHVVEADRLARVYGLVETPAEDRPSAWVPWPVYEALRAGMTAFERMGASRIGPGMVGEPLSARPMRVGQVAGAFFQTLGTRPQIGRLFEPQEEQTRDRLAVLSDGLWRTDFGADPDVPGRTVYVRDEPYTVIGVAPPGFTGTTPRRVDVWVLADMRIARFNNWNIVGRLRPGVSTEAASQEAAAVHARTAELAPRWYRDAELSAAPIRFDADRRESPEATMSRWLSAVSAIILLIAVANVVNLLLVRLVRRRRELAIRLTLGSGRYRVVRLLALEGVLLALAAGAASLLVTRLTEPVVRRALFAGEAGWTFSLLDARVVATVAAVVLATMLIVSVVPVLQLGDARLAATLRGTTQPGGSSRLRSTLTVVQAALSVVLLVGAGLFLRSLANARAVDLGVDADRVVMATANLLSPSGTDADDPMGYESRVYRTLLDAVERLPGVASAGIAVGRPLDGGAFSASVYLASGDSAPTLPSRGPWVSSVAGDYFDAVGTRVLRGRAFTDADRAGTERVMIVGEEMARTLWPGADPVGDCVRVGAPTAPCTRVVGVVTDVHRSGLHEDATLQYYLPVDQQAMFGGATLVIAPDARAPVAWPAIRTAMLEASPVVRSVEIGRLSEALEDEIRPLRLGIVTFGLSGGLALVVAVLGLYSLMSYMVAWRTRELGVRVALGATDAQITRLVVGGGTRLAAMGTAIGLGLAFSAGGWLEPHLFETSRFDPLVGCGVTAALLAVAIVAGWLPARRAARISPTEALRSE